MYICTCTAFLPFLLVRKLVCYTCISMYNVYMYMYVSVAGCLQTPVGLSFCPDGGVALACSDSIGYRNRAAQRYMYMYMSTYMCIHMYMYA